MSAADPPLNTTIDRNALHHYLWRRTSRLGTVKVVQGLLADELGITIYTMSRVVRDMRNEGRIAKVGTSQDNVATYKVIDPAVWQARQ